ncbi:hypothetical protein K7X08_023416 [Anisodus acutangulus]|uniref:Uncharacterized protein n=1 Tax=Anisodus acutangulus TaxID=402998 RepID=A0A9Q1R127_9SOLA|nr:hypothetical protein K7X08_023416 [Anisodus acutangulus]
MVTFSTRQNQLEAMYKKSYQELNDVIGGHQRLERDKLSTIAENLGDELYSPTIGPLPVRIGDIPDSSCEIQTLTGCCTVQIEIK